MIPAPSYLGNTGALVKAFGYWPSFHDAPVAAFDYDVERDAVELTLQGWEMTQEVDAQGYFKLIKRHLVRFGFYGISDAALHQFEPNNILFQLKFSSPEEFNVAGKFRVAMESAMGSDLCGSFSARTGKVLEVIPCDEKGKKIEPGASPNGGSATSGKSSVTEGLHQ